MLLAHTHTHTHTHTERERELNILTQPNIACESTTHSIVCGYHTTCMFFTPTESNNMHTT